MSKYLIFILYGCILYAAIAYYGAISNLEANTSSIVTPLMLRDAVKVITTYTMFLICIVLVSKK